MGISQDYNEEKPFKQLLAEFQALRREVFIRNDVSRETLSAFEVLQGKLLRKLEQRRSDSKEEIIRAENKKNNLIKRLVLLEKMKDSYAQDEIIKELEEYSRIRRHRDAQLARITKEIADINLTKNEFHDQMEGKQKKKVTTQSEVVLIKH
ncbi:MAG: hypothetical protein BGO43_11740 [Gammaproteobacteria bacterium 39-13]|nr:hypothetical protein [Gammaproteobacteria bacterium]OJV85296.1 MAG: hypothetical protein BGO43_11740 [Gammaproteobacteria bacterium 39-13]